MAGSRFTASPMPPSPKPAKRREGWAIQGIAAGSGTTSKTIFVPYGNGSPNPLSYTIKSP